MLFWWIFDVIANENACYIWSELELKFNKWINKEVIQIKLNSIVVYIVLCELQLFEICWGWKGTCIASAILSECLFIFLIQFLQQVEGI